MGTCETAFAAKRSSCPVMDTAGTRVRYRELAGFSLTETLYARGTSLVRHCHSHAYLTFVLSGNYSEKYMSRESACNAGTLRFLPAGEMHENVFANAATCLLVKVDPAMLQRLGEERAGVLRAPGEVSGLASTWLANRMLREFRTEDDVAGLAMEGVLLEILAESARSLADSGGSRAPAWLRRVHESLEASYLAAPSLAELAVIGGVHPVHLSREFRRYYQTTIGEHIRKRRIEHAARMLSSSSLSLSDIAVTCGFSDQSHFCALFKRHTGMTPAKYRDLSAAS